MSVADVISTGGSVGASRGRAFLAPRSHCSSLKQVRVLALR
jgi:hypothetical protein